MEKPITFVLTSCCRFDLLKRTIDSFMEKNTYPLYEYLLIDDGEDIEQHNLIKNAYGNQFKLIMEGHIGHPACVDRIYQEVKTEYIFHNQDDWEFVGGGDFIQKSIDILEEFPNIGIVCIRRDDMEHPFMPEIYSTRTDVKFQKVVPGWVHGNPCYQNDGWFGFTFNPGLRRKSDYEKMKPLSQYKYERACGWKFRDLGLEVAYLTNNYVKHIGWGRSKIS